MVNDNDLNEQRFSKDGYSKDGINSSVKIYTSDFSSFHRECHAARYQVHRPKCSCPKVEVVRKKMTEILDGMVVLPDIKDIYCIYLCPVIEFDSNPQLSEIKLRDEIFPKGVDVDFKVKCAACLLVHERNGFVCIASNSKPQLDRVRDLARSEALAKKTCGQQLHADHAHYVCTLSRRILWKLYNKNEVTLALEEISKYLSQQGVIHNALPEGTNNKIDVKLGHHLQSVLGLTRKDRDKDIVHFLTMVYDDTIPGKNICWTIDVSGGKRYLGETSFQGAVRETKEEMSLDLYDWRLEQIFPRKSNHRFDKANCYYMIQPPSPLDMERIMTRNERTKANMSFTTSDITTGISRIIDNNNGYDLSCSPNNSNNNTTIIDIDNNGHDLLCFPTNKDKKELKKQLKEERKKKWRKERKLLKETLYNMNSDITFSDGTAQERRPLNLVKRSKPFPVSKKYDVHQENTDDPSSPSLTKPNHAVKPMHKPVNRIITKTNPFGDASIVDTTDKLAALGL